MTPLIVLDLASRIADRLITSPSVPLEGPEKPVVQVQVAKELQPVLEHLTNNEPWWKSRETIGALTSILAGVFQLLGWAVYMESIAVLVSTALAIFVGLLAWYGRWRARKPLGS